MKIDTSKIDGYQDMTAEEKLAALEGFELETPPSDDKEIQRLKDAPPRKRKPVKLWKWSWKICGRIRRLVVIRRSS